ncbi:hypothetical protein SAMN06272722_10162 [Paenibacillus sp. RU5A]|nr:hypothetical protein SAMN06272722_10162 [Paenibacillus sp. RU5A]SOC65419.1 hypothetical protein SAMN05880581_1011129 [Paenibacillus sp. RU26A]SOC68631.1 hypothetical protein SAMN05880586_1011128 [Paenibacillus sp. RU5M]
MNFNPKKTALLIIDLNPEIVRIMDIKWLFNGWNLNY